MPPAAPLEEPLGPPGAAHAHRAHIEPALARPARAEPARTQPAPLRRELPLDRPFHLRLTLGPLQHGRRDPSVRMEGRTLWRATRTPEGPATEAVTVDAARMVVTAWAWGPGATWLLDALPDLVGEGDDTAAFAALTAGPPPKGVRPPGWDVVAGLSRRYPGVRIPRTGAVVEACVPTVLEQKVTGLEAKRSYLDLVTALGSPAPGPPGCGVVLPPPPAVLAATPAWAMHRWGIERKRADTLRRVGAAARRLEEATGMDAVTARRRLTAVPGLGPWSAAEVAVVALGDADAVSIGDYHLPDQVAWALAGIPRGDDRLMLELLEPWRGHRGRVLRLLVAAGVTAPRYGPRLTVRSFRHR